MCTASEVYKCVWSGAKDCHEMDNRVWNTGNLGGEHQPTHSENNGRTGYVW